MIKSYRFIFSVLSVIWAFVQQYECSIDNSQLNELLAQVSSYDQDINQLEKEMKEVEIERLDRMGYFNQQPIGKKIQVEEEYSLKKRLPYEYVENYNIFKSGSKKKFNLRIDHKVRSIEFMQIKQSRGSQGGGGGNQGVSDFTDQYIMIVFTMNNYILLLDNKGRIMHEYFAGHNIYKYATLQSNEEQTIYTLGEDYSIKSHLIRPLKKQDIEWIQKSENDSQASIIKIKSSKEIKVVETPTNSTSQQDSKKKKSLNLLIEYEGEFSIPEHTNSTLANGTKIGKSALSRHPIIQILKHYPYPLYATKNQIGFFNHGTLHTAFPQCDLTYDDILYLTIDGQHSQNIFVLQKNMEILIYDMKSQKSSCSKNNSIFDEYKCIVLMKLSSGDIDEIENKDPKKVTIQQLHNYIFFSSYDSPIAKVLNITNFKSKNADIMLDIGFYLSGMGSQQYQLDYSDEQGYFQYQTYKHSSNYGLIAYFEHLHSPQNTTEITLYTIHTQSPSWNFTENFKMPIIAIILIVFFFISYCRKKKKTTLDDVSMANIDNLIKDIQSGKKTIPNYKKDK